VKLQAKRAMEIGDGSDAVGELTHGVIERVGIGGKGARRAGKA
jgi:hypothetical protein